MDWNAFITTLADCGYDGTITVEHEDHFGGGSAERVQRGLANARAHLARFIPGVSGREGQNMAAFHIGCALITWMKIPTPAPDWEKQALREIGQAGYEGAPTSVHDGETPAEAVARYAGYGLKTAPGYFGGTFRPAVEHEQILEDARRYARFMRDAGCTELYVAAGGGDYVTRRGKTRREVAGQVQPEDALPDDEFARYAALIDEIGAITQAEGVRACFHNHAGTIIETRAEMDRLLALTDPAHVFAGPDTGHLAWASAIRSPSAATTPTASRPST